MLRTPRTAMGVGSAAQKRMPPKNNTPNVGNRPTPMQLKAR